MKENIEKLLFESGKTMYAIHQATGIAQTTLSRFKRRESDIGNMSLDNAIKLNKYYEDEVRRMIEMKVENGRFPESERGSWLNWREDSYFIYAYNPEENYIINEKEQVLVRISDERQLQLLSNLFYGLRIDDRDQLEWLKDEDKSGLRLFDNVDDYAECSRRRNL